MRKIRLSTFIYWSFFIAICFKGDLAAVSNNQTPTVSPIYPNAFLPFNIEIEVLKDSNGNPFLLPKGLQSFDAGTYKGLWLLLNGRTNGLHGFNNDPNNFPPQEQNRVVYVIDPVKEKCIPVR